MAKGHGKGFILSSGLPGSMLISFQRPRGNSPDVCTSEENLKSNWPSVMKVISWNPGR